MATRFISSDTATLFEKSTGKADVLELLWGDRVTTSETSSGRTKVKARGREGWVPTPQLGTESLLEFYFIDVGQGDGVLVRTPDHRHILIDGGFPRRNQATGKNAADFVDWKFFRDYRRRRIDLDAIITSHNDADHYGGLWDLINPDESHELNLDEVRVDVMYHAGVSWWRSPQRKRFLGAKTPTDAGLMLTRLLDNRADAVRSLKASSNPRLQGEWAKFIQRVTECKALNGTSSTRIQRLSHADEFVPGFEPGREPVPGDRHGDVAIRVLAPVEFVVGGKPAIRNLGSDSQNTNGNSLLLRFDYGRTRILLTGDLNAAAQQRLLEDYNGERLEFKCDVAKGCHHGSADISYEFLAAMEPAVTIISSGDNEGHDHPRTSVVAASATTGFMEIKDDKLASPLIYSTELARSVSLGKPSKLTLADGSTAPLSSARVEYKEKKSGDRNPRTRSRTLDRTLIVAGVIYGLVNVRTDGEKILCAVMNEKDHSWQVKTITSRF